MAEYASQPSTTQLPAFGATVQPANDAGFLENYLPYLLWRADQRLSAGFYEVLVHRGVTRSEWRVLAVLNEFGELSVLDLTAQTANPQPTITSAVGRLEGRGLVSRTPGIDDRRQRFIGLTDAGSTLVHSLIAEAKQLERDALTDVADADELTRLLQRFTGHIKTDDTGADG